MRNMTWIYILVLFLSESWSQDPGTNENLSVKPNTTSPPLKVDVYKKATFNLGSTVNLTCSNKTWRDTMYVIWTIEFKHGTCKISFSNEGQTLDSCDDGKSLRNTSTGQSYLHIPNFSAKDVGVYKCESAFTGGTENYNIDVAVTVPPSLSAWLQQKDNKMVAVCRAERGNPAANISWSLTGNSESLKTQNDSEGFVTVESELQLPEGRNPPNLSCIVRHQFWDHEKILVPQLRKDFKMLWIVLPTVGAFIVFLVASVFALKKVKLFRQCQQSDTTKSPPIEDVEEVEPYASYVQRVNSIYN